MLSLPAYILSGRLSVDMPLLFNTIVPFCSLHFVLRYSRSTVEVTDLVIDTSAK